MVIFLLRLKGDSASLRFARGLCAIRLSHAPPRGPLEFHCLMANG
jgi:hypothetical protein